MRRAAVEDLDPLETICTDIGLQQGHQAPQRRNMDKRGNAAPLGHGNTTPQPRLPTMTAGREHPDMPADPVFLAQVSSSTSSAAGSRVSRQAHEMILFTRFKEFSFIWDRAWIGFVVDSTILDIVKEYTEDFHDIRSFKMVTFDEFLSDLDCIDGMINLTNVILTSRRRRSDHGF